MHLSSVMLLTKACVSIGCSNDVLTQQQLLVVVEKSYRLSLVFIWNPKIQYRIPRLSQNSNLTKNSKSAVNFTLMHQFSFLRCILLSRKKKKSSKSTVFISNPNGHSQHSQKNENSVYTQF